MTFAEKYRPNSFDEIVGQTEVIESLKNILSRAENGEKIPHMLFVGTSGTGKTSIAIILAKIIFGSDWRTYFKEFNASDERGIDVVRGRIKYLATTKGKKIVFLDEVDNMTIDAQNALRRIMEKTKDTIFILSGNKRFKIIDAIQSRCAVYPFKRLSDRDVLRKLLEVSKKEGVTITSESKEGYTLLAKYSHGDMRWALNELEKVLQKDGGVTRKAVIDLIPSNVTIEAIKVALSGDFDRAREMIEDVWIGGGFSVESTISSAYNGIKNLNTSRDIKAKLIVKLAEAEERIQLGCNPLLQLSAFICWCWVLPHYSQSKILTDEKVEDSGNIS